MKSLKIVFLLTMLAASAISLSKGDSFLPTTDDDNNEAEGEEEEAISLRGRSRFLAHIPSGGLMSCERNPRVCQQVEGSPGPDCCRNKCVNLLRDASNCGRCGKKCSYQKICCEGKCVNPKTNEKHCGKCGNKCNKGSSCMYGMCSYA